MINLIPGINSSSSALDAERIRMEVISQNIANVNTTRDTDGNPYQRKQVVFESVLQQQGGQSQGVQVASVQTDKRPPRLVFNPGHPDANAAGMVAVPDINIHEEMADLIASSRSFEANLAVVKNGRTMAMQALSIGRH